MTNRTKNLEFFKLLFDNYFDSKANSEMLKVKVVDGVDSDLKFAGKFLKSKSSCVFLHKSDFDKIPVSCETPSNEF
ncbi:MAG: hypothetical protein IJW59_01255 [Clostridia bacterium]|nr:hypothetical protein [Clostridia bacterium]